MSVLIKGMEMPTCMTCPCCEEKLYGNLCRITNEIVPFSFYRGDKCPLIELPPHGDLIDRDALMKDGWLCLHKEVMRMGGYAIHELPLINPSIPVVIEREND